MLEKPRYNGQVGGYPISDIQSSNGVSRSTLIHNVVHVDAMVTPGAPSAELAGGERGGSHGVPQ